MQSIKYLKKNSKKFFVTVSTKDSKIEFFIITRIIEFRIVELDNENSTN